MKGGSASRDKNPLSKGIVVEHLMTEPSAPIDALKSFGSRFVVSPQTSQPFHDPAFIVLSEHARDE